MMQVAMLNDLTAAIVDMFPETVFINDRPTDLVPDLRRYPLAPCESACKPHKKDIASAATASTCGLR